MPGSHETRRTAGSTLKTTTWGALISLSAAILVAGLLGYSPRTHSGDLGRPTAQLAEQSLPPATHSAVPAQGDTTLGETIRPARILPRKSSPTESGVARASLSTATVPANAIHSNHSNLGNPSATATGNEAGSAGANPNDDRSAMVAKIAPDLKGADPEAQVEVIVQYNTAAGASDIASEGATAKADLPLVHAQLVTVKGGSLTNLASHSSVAYISPNRPVRGSLDHVVTAVNADLAYASGWNGTGVGIAVIDSGVGSVHDLDADNSESSRVVYNQSFVPGDTSTGDGFGHGTHIAGIIAGNGYGSTSSNYRGVYRGIAPEANIINLRALDSTGAGTDSSVIAAIQQAIALQNTYNIQVINLSLSRGVYESHTLDPLCQAVESAWQAGIVVVVAAGNMGQYNGAGTNGYATIGAPGNDPYVITVGATNTHGASGPDHDQLQLKGSDVVRSRCQA
jgi:subtilisin family serine protease